MKKSEIDVSKEFLTPPGYNLIFNSKNFEIDFDRVKTIEDVLIVLKGLKMVFTWGSEDCPEQFKEMYDKGFLIELEK